MFLCITVQITAFSFWFCDSGPFRYKAQEVSSMDLDKEEEDVQEDEDEAEVAPQPKPVFLFF